MYLSHDPIQMINFSFRLIPYKYTFRVHILIVSLIDDDKFISYISHFPWKIINSDNGKLTITTRIILSIINFNDKINNEVNRGESFRLPSSTTGIILVNPILIF